MVKKKTTTIKIDMDLWEQARPTINNLSGFVETCLRKYLGLDEDLQITTMQEELDKIKEANLNIHLLSEMDNTDVINTEIINEKQNRVWLSIWTVYRNTGSFYPHKVAGASEVLNVDADTLKDMLESLIMNLDKKELLLCDEWSKAWELYNEM